MLRPPPGSPLFPYPPLFLSSRSPLPPVRRRPLPHHPLRLLLRLRHPPRRLRRNRVGGDAADVIQREAGLHTGAGLVPFRKDRKSTLLNSSHANISYAVFCLK